MQANTACRSQPSGFGECVFRFLFSALWLAGHWQCEHQPFTRANKRLKIMYSPSEVKSRASKLRDVLSVMGHQIKHSESLEVISKVEGYPDWNTYTAVISDQQNNAHQHSSETFSDSTTSTPDHPIIDAIKLENEALLRESLSEEVLADTEIMSQAFYQTVVLERVSLAEVLIEEGADIGSVKIREQSLFEFAIHTERADYFKMLVFKFKHLKEIHRKNSTVLPLLVSLLNKDDDALEPVKILLDQGANINAQNRAGDTAIIIAGWDLDDLELVTYLVEQGADLNIANRNGDTPLIDAADKGNIEILEYMLRNGADTTIQNKEGRTALDVARRSEKSEAIKILAKRKESE